MNSDFSDLINLSLKKNIISFKRKGPEITIIYEENGMKFKEIFINTKDNWESIFKVKFL